MTKPAETSPGQKRTYFVSHLECSLTGEKYSAGAPRGLSRSHRPILVRYDLSALRAAVSREDLLSRTPDMWRYRELLPVKETQNIVSLGEMITPLISADTSAAKLGVDRLQIKDEGRLPTGSFKARGIAVAISMAKELGFKQVAMPTAGNAGAALAAYASRAGMTSFVFCPDDAPEITISEMCIHGARVFLVNGLITELGPLVEKGTATLGWLNLSTLREPYRVEGKKTMGFELAEQLNWHLPDVIFYPTGGGTGMIGMWKAFDELEELGWLSSGHRPRMVAVQSTTCAPIVDAFERGLEFAEPWQNGTTRVPGLRVPATIGDFLILRALRESNGFAIAIDDASVEPARAEMAASDGIHLSLEGAATYAAFKCALATGRVSKTDHVVLFNCATGLKSPLRTSPTRIDRHSPIDYNIMA